MPATNEKMTAIVRVRCYPSEQVLWLTKIERRELSRTIRQLLNKLCERKRK